MGECVSKRVIVFRLQQCPTHTPIMVFQCCEVLLCVQCDNAYTYYSSVCHVTPTVMTHNLGDFFYFYLTFVNMEVVYKSLNIDWYAMIIMYRSVLHVALICVTCQSLWGNESVQMNYYFSLMPIYYSVLRWSEGPRHAGVCLVAFSRSRGLGWWLMRGNFGLASGNFLIFLFNYSNQSL